MQVVNRLVPAGYQPFFESQGAEIVIYRQGLTSLCYQGRRKKPSWWVRFQTPERQDAYEKERIGWAQEAATRKAEHKAERQAPHTLKEGAILYASWGWEQTNIDFYQVTKVISPHMVEITPIAGETVTTTGWASDTVIAKPGAFTGEPMRKRASGLNTIKLTEYADAYPYDGRPMHRSWYA